MSEALKYGLVGRIRRDVDHRPCVVEARVVVMTVEPTGVHLGVPQRPPCEVRCVHLFLESIQDDNGVERHRPLSFHGVGVVSDRLS